MFVNDTRQHVKHVKNDRKVKTMAKETKPVNNANKIGQVYEERKKDGTTGRIGVIEEVNEKYKTYLMKDKEGKSFNITFATLKSNWRKYQGDEVVMTSEQKAEVKQAEKEELKEAKTEMAKSTETTIKFTKQERIDAIKAMRVVLKDAIKDAKYPLEVVHLSKGGTVVKLVGKRRTMFEIWLPLRYPDVYSFRMREDIDKYVTLEEEREYLKDDVNCIRYRPKRERFDDVLKVVLTAVEKFVEETGFLQDKHEKNETNEEEEKN